MQESLGWGEIQDTGVKSNTSLTGAEKLRQYKKEYHIKNRGKILEKVSKHYQENKEKRLSYGKKWRDSNPDKMRLYRKHHVKKLKDETFAAYGGYVCNCCGESEPLFLTIDHINGKGNEHRRSIGNTGGKDFYSWLRKNHFPEGFQVLCYNCNMAKGRHKNCPHVTTAV